MPTQKANFLASVVQRKGRPFRSLQCKLQHVLPFLQQHQEGRSVFRAYHSGTSAEGSTFPLGKVHEYKNCDGMLQKGYEKPWKGNMELLFTFAGRCYN